MYEKRLKKLNQWFGVSLDKKDIEKLQGSQKETLLFYENGQPSWVIQHTDPKQYDRLNDLLTLAKDHQVGPSHFEYSPDRSERRHRYMMGHHPTLEDLQNPSILQVIAKTLKTIHTMPWHKDPQCPHLLDETHHLLSDLAPTYLEFLPKTLIDFADSLFDQDWGDAQCLIHRDCHPKNIILNDQGCTFIDWEEASLGSPYLDLASLAHFIDPDHLPLWLSAYFGRPLSEHEKKLFFNYLQLRVAWCTLWAIHKSSTYALSSLPKPIPLRQQQKIFIEGTFEDDPHAWWTFTATMIQSWIDLKDYSI